MMKNNTIPAHCISNSHRTLWGDRSLNVSTEVPIFS